MHAENRETKTRPLVTRLRLLEAFEAGLADLMEVLDVFDVPTNLLREQEIRGLFKNALEEAERNLEEWRERDFEIDPKDQALPEKIRALLKKG